VVEDLVQETFLHLNMLMENQGHLHQLVDCLMLQKVAAVAVPIIQPDPANQVVQVVVVPIVAVVELDLEMVVTLEQQI
jgi:hypothetical protein